MRSVIETEAEWILQRLSETITDKAEHNYWQGRIDSLAWALRQLNKEEK